MPILVLEPTRIRKLLEGEGPPHARIQFAGDDQVINTQTIIWVGLHTFQ